MSDTTGFKSCLCLRELTAIPSEEIKEQDRTTPPPWVISGMRENPACSSCILLFPSKNLAQLLSGLEQRNFGEHLYTCFVVIILPTGIRE